MFYTVNKIGALALYALTIATYVATLSFLTPEMVHWLRVGVAVLLGAHLLEVVIFRKQVALYRGPFVVSAVLTLLFGFLHWKPLADAQR